MKLRLMEGVEVGNIEKDKVKEALKEALKEWLDDKFMQFGKWSLTGIGAAALTALTYFILKTNGWIRLN